MSVNRRPSKADKQSLRMLLAERGRQMREELALAMAKRDRPVYGNTDVPPAEQRRQFWQVADGWTPEMELELLTGVAADGTPMLDPETGMPAKPLPPEMVGVLKYPKREPLAKGGGRLKLADQVKWVNEMVRLGPPAPEPLELQAMMASVPDAEGLVGMQPGAPTQEIPPEGPVLGGDGAVLPVQEGMI